jgi:hypothetical protein
MATVAELKERAASLLPPGSEVQQAFVCQTAANFVIFVINWLTGLTLGLITYRCVAITGDAIYVFDAPRTSGGANPRSVIATLPRHTQLGPVHGRWSEFALLGKRYWIKQRFQDQITAADAAAGFRY